MGGYYLRGKKARAKELGTIDVKAIESKPKKVKKLEHIDA
jgi:hypothetical protein